MKIDPAYCLEWIYISHFYRGYYVWQYATSMVGAAQFSRAIASEGVPARERFVNLALADTDRRVAEGLAVAPSFMLACLLWHEVVDRWNALQAGGEAPFPALQQAVEAVFDARIGDISGRGKLAADMREIWLMQPRFERRSGNTPRALVEQPRYRAAYDFLRLRADAGELSSELAEWWEDFALGDDDERVALLKAVREQQPPRRVQTVRPVTPMVDAPMAEDESAGEAAGEAAPRKRRRRRRKPAGAAGGDAGPGDLPTASPD